ncbi:MAG: glycogen synthase [Trueperaceae bacterium]|nr:glycogen synthase [Trueperaceae bacterium]
MRVLFVSSEVYPFSKTGGLADVAGALPAALVRQGHEVLVVTPWYKTLAATPPPLWVGDVSVPFDGGFSDCGVGTLECDGVRYAFVGHDDYQRDELYGYDDDVYRFARFTRAVPQVAEHLDFRPDIVHANDWHTGHLPMMLAHGWHLPDGFPGLPSVFTVHNVQYQGASDLGATLYWLRLPSDLTGSYANHFGRANAMQSALGFAHHVTTVSPSYAEEIKEPEYGYGLDGTFRHIDDKLSGILNGLDTDVWDPATDPHLAQPYSADDLTGKRLVKALLCERFGLEPSPPLIGVVSRLADQKGIDLVLYGLDALLGQGWNLLVLGSGDSETEETLRGAAAAHPGRVGSYIGYNEELAHQVYAGCDALAIPSRFEPCGLSQMIAMRYGTLPVARATGGLRDTIRHGYTGFLFEHISSDGVIWASGQARETYRDARDWQQMMRAAMAEDFSWDSSARAYAALYERLV